MNVKHGRAVDVSDDVIAFRNPKSETATQFKSRAWTLTNDQRFVPWRMNQQEQQP